MLLSAQASFAILVAAGRVLSVVVQQVVESTAVDSLMREICNLQT